MGGAREPFWSGGRLRRGESESCLITYWKTSKPGILKLSITASRSCSLGKSGSCCIDFDRRRVNRQLRQYAEGAPEWMNSRGGRQSRNESYNSSSKPIPAKRKCCT